MTNKITLTFAGDEKQLVRSFDRAGDAADRFGRRVDDSSDLLDGFGRAGAGAAGKFSLRFNERIGPLVANAPVSGPLAAAVVAAAPTIAAALTSGILLGLGGGVLAAGIVAAAKDPKVAAAFGGLKQRASKAFAGFADPFKGPLIRAADTFGDAIERMAPAFKRMGATVAPLIDKLAPAFAQMAEKAMPGIEKAVAASVPLFEKIAEHAPAIGEAISKFFEAIAKGAPSAVKFIDVLLKAAEFVLPLLGQALTLLTEHFEAIWGSWKTIFGALGAAWNGLKTGATAAAKWVADKFNATVSFLKGLPKRAGSAFAGMFDGIKSAFRSALNWVIDRWNNFSIPGISTPFGTIGGFNTPNLPRFHTGGVVPGAPGTEVPILAMAGERVTPAGRTPPTVIELRGDGSRLGALLVEVLRTSIQAKGGNVQLVLGTGRG
jgi:hypothetical protein